MLESYVAFWSVSLSLRDFLEGGGSGSEASFRARLLFNIVDVVDGGR